MSPIYEESSASISALSKDHAYVNGDFQRRLLEEELRLRSEVSWFLEPVLRPVVLLTNRPYQLKYSLAQIFELFFLS